MKDDPLSSDQRYTVTIGTFDGVHLGHRSLFSHTIERARSTNTPSAAATFAPHPRTVLNGDTGLLALMSVEDRVRHIHKSGISRVILVEFTREVASLSARQFLERLGEQVPLDSLVVGENFRLGRRREAGTKELRAIGTVMGFEVVVATPVTKDEAPVSSTRIRKALTEHGDVVLAAELLGRPYELAGVVVQGMGRGRTIGVPTANVRVPEGIVVPRNGVYRCSATIDGQAGLPLRGVLNIGIRPTFGASGRSVELHILDWSGELYGVTVRIGFAERLRDERRFESVDALVVQIQRDIARARDAG